MQVTETSQEGLKHEFKVVIEAKEVSEKIDHRLGEISHQVDVPGFRPGKVPVNVLKQRYGDAVRGEVLEKAVTDSANQAMAERGMRPAMEPKIEIEKFEEGADLEYTLAIEVLPEITPMEFGSIELEKVVANVPDSDIDETLEQLAGRQKQSKPIEKARKSKSGDIVVIDFVGKVDGKEFAGGAAEDYYLELGSGMFIPGFEDQLVDLSVGGDATVKVKFPEAYGSEELSGKDAEFAVKLKEIREPSLPEIDEEFAKANGFEGVDAMRQGVRDTLQNNYDQISRGRVKRDLLDALADGHDFDVPEGMVDLEFDQIWQQIEEAKKKGELEEEDKAKSDDELKEEYRGIAARRVRLGLLLSDVGQKNNIEVTEAEVNQAVMAEAQQHPGHEREVFELYQNNPNAKANLRAPIFENKVVDFILELAKVSEKSVTPDELLKIDQEKEEAEAKPAKKPAKKKAAPKKKAAAKKPAAKKPAAKKPAAKGKSAGADEKKA